MSGEIVPLRPSPRGSSPGAASRDPDDQALAADAAQRKRSLWTAMLVALSGVATLTCLVPSLLATDFRIAYLGLWFISMAGFLGSLATGREAERRRTRAGGRPGGR